jgi:hypothetical protein
MLIYPTIGAAFLALLGLGFYTVRKMNPGWFRVRTPVWRVFSFDQETSSAVKAEKPDSKVIPPCHT